MAELRWILLLAGLLFLLALAGWEMSRARRSRRAAELDGQRAIDAVLASSARRADEHASSPPELSSDETAPPAVDTGEEQPRAAASSEVAPTSAARIEPTLDESDLLEPVTAMDPSAPIEANPPLRVEWPEERERHLLAVRIVAPSGQRLGGRAVRQALGACGFVHGPYRIYHQPAADGRALLSCANLTRPGDFDPLTLDFQRLTGLSMFAVLPGPLGPLVVLEHLLTTAAELARRLHAELADERGAPLDQTRVAQLAAVAQEWTASDPTGARAAALPGSMGASGA